MNNCQRYEGYHGPTGYARKKTPNGWLLYRHNWIEKNGPVPEGMELDHLCRNRWCINPDHLEPVTHAENVRRGANTKFNDSTRWIVRAHRRLHGMSQHQVASATGVSQQHVGKIIREGSSH